MTHHLLDTSNGNILVVNPDLAAWIGLNEAIFLRQLHYIITKRDDVGKMADGKKWYRDKPHDFVVKFFPFWDEGVVKRTINNLRNDGLILARSDLNTIAKDRSLWYTVNYPALDGISGPVYRLQAKAEKRRDARKARTEQEQYNDDYTKVQNVLLTDTEVQNEPLTSVQNVPTPKDSILPKDKISTNVEKPAPKKPDKPPPPPAVAVYRKIARRYPDQAIWEKIDQTVGADPNDLDRWRQVVTEYIGCGWNKINLVGMLQFFVDGRMPTTKPVKNGGKHDGRSRSSTNGQYPANEGQPAEGASEDTRAIAAAFRAKSRANRPAN